MLTARCDAKRLRCARRVQRGARRHQHKISYNSIINKLNNKHALTNNILIDYKKETRGACIYIYIYMHMCIMIVICIIICFLLLLSLLLLLSSLFVSYMYYDKHQQCVRRGAPRRRMILTRIINT